MRTVLSLLELSARINPSVQTQFSSSGFSAVFDNGDSFSIHEGYVSLATSSSPAPTQSSITAEQIAQIIELTPAQIGALLQRMEAIHDRIGVLNQTVANLEAELSEVFAGIADAQQRLQANPNDQDQLNRLSLLEQKRDALLTQYVVAVDELKSLNNEYNNIVDLINASGDFSVVLTHLLQPVYNYNYYNLGYPLVWA